MGIQGLLPFVEKATRKANVSEFSGGTVAIDAYCWLHKGAFSCAEKLARGEETNQYVLYCLKFINMLLSHNIKPILVFDGQHLPAKADTEKVRRERREQSRKKAAELLRLDRPDEARNLIRRCVDVTHHMALSLIKECRAMNVDCIVAPFEADAQLAYLNISKIAHLVITEDSDLLLFGCTKVLFKMDVLGNGLLVEQEMLPLAMKQTPNQFSMDKFRYMCILSGCDYLPSLPGIGLSKACKFIKRTGDPDISRGLTRLGAHLNMSGLVVSPEYREKFLDADRMFKHQPVFCPLSRRIVPLTPLPPGVPDPLPVSLSPETALQLAYGNLEPLTLKQVDNWDPKEPQRPMQGSKSWNVTRAKHKSIWGEGYEVDCRKVCRDSNTREVKRTSTLGVEVVKNVTSFTNRVQDVVNKPSVADELQKLREKFTSPVQPVKKPCLERVLDEGIEITGQELTPKKIDVMEEKISPILGDASRKNPSKSAKEETPVSANRQRSGLSKLTKIKRTVINETCIVQSRYFGSGSRVPETPPKKEEDKEETVLKDIANLPDAPSPENTPSEKPSLISPPSRRNVFAVTPPKEDSDFDRNFSIDNNKKQSFLKLIDSIGGGSEKSDISEVVAKAERSSLVPCVKSTQSTLDSKVQKIEPSNNEVTHVRSEQEPQFVFIETPPSSQGTPPSSLGSSQGSKSSKKTTLLPAKRVGLSRKKSMITPPSSGKQKSLLSMFSFQPKAKLKP